MFGMSRKPSSRFSVIDGSTHLIHATPQNKENVFGKLNIPKSQSSTSKRRTSFFRKGIVSGGRKSMFGQCVGPEKMKESRPLHDRNYVQQSIKVVHEFLLDQGFPGTITLKTLQSPSTKEFLKVFEFIYCFLEPSYQIPSNKVEEEIPKLLKDLGYPVALSISCMYSVGAPHRWPQALGALIWLIDVAKIMCHLEEQELLFSDVSGKPCDVEQGAEFKKLLMEYCCDTYRKFLEGADTFEKEDEAVLNELKKLYKVDEQLIHSQQEKHRVIMEQVETMERECQTDCLEVKRAEKLRMQADLKKIQLYHCTLEAHKAALENKTAGLCEELKAVEVELDGLKQEKSRLQHILEKQKLTPAEIERINRERKELQHSAQSLTRSLEEIQQLVWNEEITLSKTKEKVELKVVEFNELARKLKLIPQTAKNACGQDFAIRAKNIYTTRMQCRSQIQIPLKSMMTDVENECRRLAIYKLNQEESLEQVKFYVLDKQNDVKRLKQLLRRLYKELEQDLREMAQEEEKWAAEVDSAEAHKKRLEKNMMCGYEEAKEELKATQQQYYAILQDTTEETRTVMNHLMGVYEPTVKHISAVEEFCKNHRLTLDKLIHEDEPELEQTIALVRDFSRRIFPAGNNTRISRSV